MTLSLHRTKADDSCQNVMTLTRMNDSIEQIAMDFLVSAKSFFSYIRIRVTVDLKFGKSVRLQ